MAKIHRVHTDDNRDIGVRFVADDEDGHFASDDTIASVVHVKAFDADGAEVADIFETSPAPSVVDLDVYARVAEQAATTDQTLYVEWVVLTASGQQVVWQDSAGQLPRLYINATP